MNAIPIPPEQENKEGHMGAGMRRGLALMFEECIYLPMSGAAETLCAFMSDHFFANVIRINNTG